MVLSFELYFVRLSANSSARAGLAPWPRPKLVRGPRHETRTLALEQVQPKTLVSSSCTRLAYEPGTARSGSCGYELGYSLAKVTRRRLLRNEHRHAWISHRRETFLDRHSLASCGPPDRFPRIESEGGLRQISCGAVIDDALGHCLERRVRSEATLGALEGAMVKAGWRLRDNLLC